MKESVEKYFEFIEEPKPKMIENYEPDICHSCATRMNVCDCFFICPICGLTILFLTENDSSVYSNEYTCVKYKRVDYFKQLLEKIQGKQKINITNEELELIKINLPLHNHNFKITLKALNLKKYNKFIPTLKRLLNLDVLLFSKELEEQLIYQFNLYQNFHFKNNEEDEIINLNYNFILKNILIHLNYTEHADKIEILKDKKKLLKHKKKWLDFICEIDEL